MMEEQTVLRGPESFVTIRHLTVRGTNFHIGQKLGEMARERYGTTADQFRGSPVFARARRQFFQHNYPIHWERLRGVADALGFDPDDDRWDLAGLTYYMDVPASVGGCSAVYYPPSTTADARSYLSRNYDFPIVSLAELIQIPVPPGTEPPPMMCEPYVMSWYPEDGGYASMALHGFDLLAGTLDGINSEGLVVSILADDESRAELGPRLEMHPGLQQAIGVHELQAMRLLLDTCATAGEAKTALLTIKQYYRLTPCRYIVADASGSSFIYENSTGRNAQYVFEGTGHPQAVTNHQLCRHGVERPGEVGPVTIGNSSFWRYRRLLDRLSAQREPFTVDDIKANNACVDVYSQLEAMAEGAGAGDDTVPPDPPASPRLGGGDMPPVRTVWHSVYDQRARSVEVSFYMGDDVDEGGIRRERRSDYFSFALAPERANT